MHPGILKVGIKMEVINLDLQGHYTPRFNKVERGVYWFHLVHLSVCKTSCQETCTDTKINLQDPQEILWQSTILHWNWKELDCGQQSDSVD